MQWEKLSETIQIAIDDTHRFGTDAFLLEHFAAYRGQADIFPYPYVEADRGRDGIFLREGN